MRLKILFNLDKENKNKFLAPNNGITFKKLVFHINILKFENRKTR